MKFIESRRVNEVTKKSNLAFLSPSDSDAVRWQSAPVLTGRGSEARAAA
ncbi:hypothetical protein AWB77_01453 [Caballeronia fortuita]|uniref:Uncharacterized protein n=1 Tax=Caballeronia fortuita TaxID=1777138 RepID=A0A158A7P5_9BURK|nr:hypothetical protein AWB77_01453 [Caballeronia fortuita]